MYGNGLSLVEVLGVLGILGYFNGLHDHYANSYVNSQTSLARSIGGPTDFTNSLPAL